MGPFSNAEMEQLKMAGIIEASYPVRDTEREASHTVEEVVITEVEEVPIPTGRTRGFSRVSPSCAPCCTWGSIGPTGTMGTRTLYPA